MPVALDLADFSLFELDLAFPILEVAAFTVRPREASRFHHDVALAVVLEHRDGERVSGPEEVRHRVPSDEEPRVPFPVDESTDRELDGFTLSDSIVDVLGLEKEVKGVEGKPDASFGRRTCRLGVEVLVPAEHLVEVPRLEQGGLRQVAARQHGSAVLVRFGHSVPTEKDRPLPDPRATAIVRRVDVRSVGPPVEGQVAARASLGDVVVAELPVDAVLGDEVRTRPAEGVVGVLAEGPTDLHEVRERGAVSLFGLVLADDLDVREHVQLTDENVLAKVRDLSELTTEDVLFRTDTAQKEWHQVDLLVREETAVDRRVEDLLRDVGVLLPVRREGVTVLRVLGEQSLIAEAVFEEPPNGSDVLVVRDELTDRFVFCGGGFRRSRFRSALITGGGLLCLDPTLALGQVEGEVTRERDDRRGGSVFHAYGLLVT